MRSSGPVVWVVVVANLLAVVVAVITNVATDVLPESWRPFQWIAWPVLGLLVLGGVPLAVRLHRAGAGHAVSAERDRYTRQQLLGHVRTVWIEGVLGQSLHRRTIIELGLEERPDVVRRPWDIVLETPDRRPRPIPPGTSLVDVLRQHRGLLVLGAPGAGKTTMLLTLLEDLLAAPGDDSMPVPAVFPLAGWAGQSLEDWLVDQLCGPLYGLRRDLAEMWIAEDRVIPLLDGLDEVPLDRRLACARAIDEFHSTHRLLPTVVASRQADYDAMGLRLAVDSAVLIQPLTPSQIDDYLARLGDVTAHLRAALAEPLLADLLRTPFLLTIAVQTYQDDAPDDLGGGDRADRETRLITAFVKRTLSRKAQQRRFDPDDAVRWLAFCARSMGQRLATFFFMEDVDTRWLSDGRRTLVVSLVALPAAFLAGAVMGTVLGVLYGPEVGVVAGFGVGILFFSNLGMSERTAVPYTIGASRLTHLFDHIANWARSVVQLGVVVLAVCVVVAVVLGVPSGVLSILLGHGEWLLGLLKGPIAMVAAGGLVLAFLGAMATSAGGNRSSLRDRPVGAGLRDAVWLGIAVTLSFGIPAAALLASVHGTRGALVGTLIGLTAGYLMVWRGLVGYWLVRISLRRAGVVPRDQSGFLDYAVERMVLHNIGGGYVFAHRLLLEHFAALELNTVDSALPAVDLRPEALLQRAVRQAKAERPGIQALLYAGSTASAATWAPTALQVARTLRGRLDDTPDEPLPDIDATLRWEVVNMAATAFSMVVAAESPDLSRPAAVELAELLVTEQSDRHGAFTLEAITALRPLASGEGDLADRARTALDILSRADAMLAWRRPR